mmetsp:Transcript_102953/g.182882  ORF Transcript_102953/g.182882 Transcript_102953/m.182882 type:complete len:260 (-) Transcript_102953:1519-2298(-)
MSSKSSSAPRFSAMTRTHLLRSCQKVKANFKSSIGCTQHGNFFVQSVLKLSAAYDESAGYSKKNFTTMPMQARGSMKVGRSAGVSGYCSLMGDAHMKPFGSSFTRPRSFSRMNAREASTSCLNVRFKARTSAWKAARSKSTSASHMLFFRRMGTNDITRQSSSMLHTFCFIFPSISFATGYLTSLGNGLSGCAASKGSLLSSPSFMSSSAVRQASVRLVGVSLSTSLSTVAPPSSLEMSSSFSRTMKWTRAERQCRSGV